MFPNLPCSALFIGVVQNSIPNNVLYNQVPSLCSCFVHGWNEQLSTSHKRKWTIFRNIQTWNSNVFWCKIILWKYMKDLSLSRRLMQNSLEIHESPFFETSRTELVVFFWCKILWKYMKDISLSRHLMQNSLEIHERPFSKHSELN